MNEERELEQSDFLSLFLRIDYRMKYVVYILWSETLQQYYCVQTNNLDDRLHRHNSSQSKSTVRGIPWKVVATIDVANRSEAFRLEKKIKKRGIVRFLTDSQ